MSTTEKHPITNAGVEHDRTDNVPAQPNDPSATESAAEAINKRPNEREIPTDVMPDWEEL